MYESKKIVLMMPALNEAQNIGGVLEQVPGYIDEVIVINDGSSDSTKQIAEQYGALVVSHSEPRGLGIAFNTGITTAMDIGFDILINMDSDGQFNVKDIKKLIQPLIDNKADFTTASRFKDKDLYPKMPKIKFWGNKRIAALISRLTKQKFYDVSCGFRAYSFDTVLRLNLFGEYTYTQESILDFAFKGLRILEIPVAVRGVREFGKSRIASNLFVYAYSTFNIILRTFRDYKPLKLFIYLSSFCFLIGIPLWIFLFFHYLLEGAFTPYKWVGFTGGFFNGIGIFLLGLGFVLDMFARMRINQENILYELKKENIRKTHSKKI